MNISFHDSLMTRHKDSINAENCRICELFGLLMMASTAAMLVIGLFRESFKTMANTYFAFFLLAMATYLFTRLFLRRHLNDTFLGIAVILLENFAYCLTSGILYNINKPSVTVYAIMVASFSAFTLPFLVPFLFYFCTGVTYCALALLLKPEYGLQDTVNYILFFMIASLFSYQVSRGRRERLQVLDETIRRKDETEDLLNKIPSGVGIIRIQSGHQMKDYMNDAYYRMLNSTRVEDQLKNGSNFFSSIVAEDRPAIEEIFQTVLHGCDRIDFNYRISTDHNATIWLRAEGNVIRRDPERVILYCSFSNVTEINRVLNDQLQKNMQALTLAQNAIVDRAAFYARMSHDMRTPLNGILGTTALAIDAEEHSPQMTEYLHDIQFSGHFLLNLINDLLDLSKIENGAMQLSPEPYDYFSFIDNMTKMIAPLCLEKNITLNMNPMPENITINVDKLRFQQIFFNIFSNAAKYTPEGGTIDHFSEISFVDPTHIDCKCHVVDNGIGMSEEFQKHLFEPYAREKNGTTAQGTGLGLGIANELAHLMGGELTVHSELGKGTEVIIHTVLEILPAQQTEQAEPAATEAQYDSFCGRHILLCEDQAINAKIAARVMEKQGITVDVATDGKQGLEAFANSKKGYYDMILMDIRMPVMDGIEAAKAIRRLPRRDASSVPILALSANAYPEDVQESLNAGMNAHLSKPIEPDALYKALTKYLL